MYYFQEKNPGIKTEERAFAKHRIAAYEEAKEDQTYYCVKFLQAFSINYLSLSVWIEKQVEAGSIVYEEPV